MTLYVPELIELINDEEAYIRIEAVAIVTNFLNRLEAT